MLQPTQTAHDNKACEKKKKKHATRLSRCFKKRFSGWSKGKENPTKELK